MKEKTAFLLIAILVVLAIVVMMYFKYTIWETIHPGVK
jgi:hypothetical protein